MSKNHSPIGKFKRNEGFRALSWLLGIPAVIVTVLLAAIGFYEGRKAYWDNEVRTMCAKDGGVQIIEKVTISKAEASLLPRNDGKLSVAIKELAAANAPVYSESRTVRLRDSGPVVTRTEHTVVRRSDKKVVARWIYYARGGGDFPTYAHPSSFECPDLRRITSDQEQLFVLAEGSK